MDKRYILPIALLVLAVVVLVVAFAAGGYYAAHWFPRGASIVILLAAAAEYLLSQAESLEINKRTSGIGALSRGMIVNLDMPEPFATIRRVAHIIIGVGTLAWGFGDLIFTAPQSCQ